jgi:hypothetical protein
MKSPQHFAVFLSASLVASLLGSLAFAVPAQVYYDDTQHCDPLIVPTDVDELGIGQSLAVAGTVAGPFPKDEEISAFAFEEHMPVCMHSDDPDSLDSIVSITNLTVPQRSFSALWYVANPNTYISNWDGVVGQHGSADMGSGPAFRIDDVGHNRPLLSESGTADGIFEPGETWKFVVQDYAAGTLGLDAAAFTSIGVAGGSLGGGKSSGSIIGIPMRVPEPSGLALLAIGLVAPALRRRQRCR